MKTIDFTIAPHLRKISLLCIEIEDYDPGYTEALEYELRKYAEAGRARRWLRRRERDEQPAG
jgi:hypothetical protein